MKHKKLWNNIENETPLNFNASDNLQLKFLQQQDDLQQNFLSLSSSIIAVV